MSPSSERMLKLMAYADGELDAAERAEVEKLLAQDAEAARFVAQLAPLGDYVRLAHETSIAPRTANFDIADSVMSAIASAPAHEGVATPATVVSIDHGARRRKVAAGLAAVFALAASIFLVARPKEAPIAPVAQAPIPALNAPPSESAAAGPGVDVDVAESPGNSVSVFYLPNANELSTSVVVWVDEPGDKK